MEEKKIIYNSKFQLDISLNAKEKLEFIPNNLYMFKPPLISVMPDADLCFKEMKGVLCLRLDEEGKVESEVYDLLINNSFDLKLYYPNKNCLNWEYRHCEVDTIEYDEFYNKSKNDRPFNLLLNLEILQAVYYSNNRNKRIFGVENLPTNELSLDNE